MIPLQEKEGIIMKKIEVHCKTKYSKDYDSLIDIERIFNSFREIVSLLE